MKRIVTILLVLTCMLGLTGCDPAWDEIDGDELLEHTVKIELYDYENTKPKLLKLNRRKKPVFDFDKATFIAELEESLRRKERLKALREKTGRKVRNAL